MAGGTSGFATADVDSAGNVDDAWSESADYHTYLASLHAADVTRCNQSITDVENTPDGQPTVQPGFTAPLQMDRDAVSTTVFPWVAAGGTPGRVAVAFYGTTQDGDPNTSGFRAAWDVYVSQTTNAFATTTAPSVGQVKATTHPFHYDSICLNGLGCDISGGDRSLADFFAITYNRKNGKLSVVFNRGNKRPNDGAGLRGSADGRHPDRGPVERRDDAEGSGQPGGRAHLLGRSDRRRTRAVLAAGGDAVDAEPGGR